MAILKKQILKAKNEKTRAAELTLRQSIYPLALVTVLFFLWVRIYPLIDYQTISINY